jgi:hypothetical protein
VDAMIVFSTAAVAASFLAAGIFIGMRIGRDIEVWLVDEEDEEDEEDEAGGRGDEDEADWWKTGRKPPEWME